MRRGALEIYRDILITVHEGRKQITRIMYGSNMSWGSLNPRIDKLIKRGLIVKKKNKYFLTNLGERVMSNLESASRYLLD